MAARVTTYGATEARMRLQLAASAASDMRPALVDVAREIELRTDNAFRAQRSPSGETWNDLAQSTKVARLRKRKTAWNKIVGKKNGERTKVRDAAHAAEILSRIESTKLTALVDTGRARNSQHCDVTGPHSVQWSAVGYLLPHMAGTEDGQPPKRNPTVFELVGGEWQLISSMMSYARSRLVDHVKGPG